MNLIEPSRITPKISLRECPLNFVSIARTLVFVASLQPLVLNYRHHHLCTRTRVGRPCNLTEAPTVQGRFSSEPIFANFQTRHTILSTTYVRTYCSNKRILYVQQFPQPRELLQPSYCTNMRQNLPCAGHHGYTDKATEKAERATPETHSSTAPRRT